MELNKIQTLRAFRRALSLNNVQICKLKAPLGGQPPPLVSSLAFGTKAARGETKTARRWVQIGLRGARISQNPSQDRPRRLPREAKTRRKPIKIITCSQDGSRCALGGPKVNRAVSLGLHVGGQNGARIEKNTVKIRCHFCRPFRKPFFHARGRFWRSFLKLLGVQDRAKRGPNSRKVEMQKSS